MDDAQKKELYYGKLLFKEGGEPQEKFKDYPGIQHLAGLVDYKSSRLDHWHVFELGGTTLSKSMFDIKGEFYKGERIYGVESYLYLANDFR